MSLLTENNGKRTPRQLYGGSQLRLESAFQSEGVPPPQNSCAELVFGHAFPQRCFPCLPHPLSRLLVLFWSPQQVSPRTPTYPSPLFVSVSLLYCFRAVVVR